MHSRLLTISLLTLLPTVSALAQTTTKSAHAGMITGQGAKIGIAKVTSTAKGVRVSVNVSQRSPRG